MTDSQRKRQAMGAVTTVLLTALAIAACDDKECSPGSTQSCVCTTGVTGAQSCNSSGTGWQSCVCDGADTSTDSDVPLDVHADGPCVTDGDCDNGLACDGEETCQDGECAPGESLDCDDGDACTLDSCDEDVGGCVNAEMDVDGDGFVDMSCGGLDCDDSRADVFPESTAVGCGDDIDQDCDGVTDEPAPRDDASLVYDSTGAQSSIPELAWTGSEFGVVWERRDFGDDSRTILFTRVSQDGLVVGSAVQVAEPERVADAPDIAWTGSGFGVVYRSSASAEGVVEFAGLSAAGTVAASEVLVSDPSYNAQLPACEWTGSEFGVFWDDPTGTAFARVGAGGDVVAPRTLLSSGRNPMPLWTGSEFAVVTNVWLNRYSPTGATIGSEVVLEGIESPWDVTWTGSELGVLWNAMSGDTLEFTRHDVDGTRLGDRIPLLTGLSPTVMCSPVIESIGSSGWVVVCASGDGLQILHVVEGMTEPADEAIVPSPMPASGNPVGMAWTGSTLGLVWEATNLYFVAMGDCG